MVLSAQHEAVKTRPVRLFIGVDKFWWGCTPLKTNMSTEKQWLVQMYFLLEWSLFNPFLGDEFVSFQGCQGRNYNFIDQVSVMCGLMIYYRPISS